MFSDVKELLDNGEEIRKQSNPSRFNSKHLKWFAAGIIYLVIVSIAASYAVFGGFIGFSSLMVLLLIPGIVLILYIETKRQFVKYYFTTDKIIKEKGILDKNFTTIAYENITDIKLDKDFEERIFDVGDLHINSAGTDKTEQVLDGLKDPESYRVIISQRKEDKKEFEIPEESANETKKQLEQVRQEMRQLERKGEKGTLTSDQRNKWYKLKGREEQLMKEKR